MVVVVLMYMILFVMFFVVIDFDMLLEDDELEEVGFEYEDLLDW